MSTILENVNPHQGASFSLTNRVQRVCWGMVYNLLFQTSPRPLHAWRAFLLRLFGAKLGAGCHVYPKAKIWAPWNLILDDHAGIADDVSLLLHRAHHARQKSRGLPGRASLHRHP